MAAPPAAGSRPRDRSTTSGLAEKGDASLHHYSAGKGRRFNDSRQISMARISGVAGPIVRLYSRRTCGLCDEARKTILVERGRGSPFQFDEVFIDGDADLERAFGLRVPVVEIDGVEEFELVVDPGRFRLAVRGSGS